MDPARLAAEGLGELDPYALLEVESARIRRFLAGLDEEEWSAPTACEGWDRRDLVSHLLAVDDYFLAGLTDRLGELFERLAAAGAHDLDSFNAAGVEERSGRSTAELLGEWEGLSAEVVRRFRDHGDDDMGTSVGPYPARWQAFHAAAEWATHADDLGVPATSDEEASRTAWRARVARFALAEAKDDLEVRAVSGGTRVRGRGVDVVLDDAELVAAVAARLPDDAGHDAGTRRVLSSMP